MTFLERRNPEDKMHGPPLSPRDLKTALRKLVNALEGITALPDIIIGGDFNLLHVNFPEDTSTKNYITG